MSPLMSLSRRFGTLALLFVASRGLAQTVLYLQEGGSHIRRQQLDSGTWTYVAAGDEPAISADGSRIAFVKSLSDGNGYRIMVANIDGSDQRPISPPFGLNCYQPCWSPDGQRVAFAVQYPNQSSYGPDIWVVNLDGSNARQITTGVQGDEHPAWSPDGEWIAFQRGGLGTTSQSVMVVHPDGTGTGVFAQGTGGGYGVPRWFPDGQGLAAASGSEVCLFDASGNLQSSFSANGRIFSLTVSADRSRILYYVWETATEGAVWNDGDWFGYRGGLYPSCPIFEPGMVYPYRFSVVEGESAGMGLASFFAADGSEARVFSDPQTLGACLELEGLCTLPNPASLHLEATASADRLGLSQQVKVFDYVADRFVTVDGRVAPVEPASIDIELTGMKARVVNQDRHMKARRLVAS